MPIKVQYVLPGDDTPTCPDGGWEWYHLAAAQKIVAYYSAEDDADGQRGFGDAVLTSPARIPLTEPDEDTGVATHTLTFTVPTGTTVRVWMDR